MMRFYGMTDEECLIIPARRFFALYSAIRHLELEDEGREISVYHNSKPGDRIRQISNELRKRQKPPAVSASALAVLGQPGVSYEAVPGSIEALRERQKAAAERIKQEREAAAREAALQSKGS